MPILPTTIEAENFDYSPINGNGRTYYDTDAGNEGNEYRTSEDVDVQTCSEGGYALGWMEPGEWLTYTVYVPETGTYDLSIRYSANNANGTIQFSFGGVDKTGEVAVPSTQGWENWTDLRIAEGVLLSKGVQNVKVYVGGIGMAFNLNNFTISESSACASAPITESISYEAGIKYNYYEGVWDYLPDFASLPIIDSGVVNAVGLGNGEKADGFAYDFNGYVHIETDGEYTFYTTSDDGSSLSIDGVRIVSNDGTHGAEEQQGSICLQEGYHEINVGYFEKTGGNDVLEAEYEGPGITKQSIDNLYHLSDDLITTADELIDSELKVSFSVFPNPFNDKITVSFRTLSVETKIEVLNVLGEVISAQDISRKLEEINLGNESSGLYLIRVVSGNQVITKEIIKQ